LSLRPTPAGSDLNPIEPTNLRTMARAAIRAHIITGQLKPGVIYPVSYFATRLGVSATPVREALLDLASQGLVELARNKGFRVPELSEHDLDEIYQLRLMLEPPAVVMAVGKLSAEDKERCARLARKIEECAADGDLTGFLENDRVFHRALLEPIGNRKLLTIIDELRDSARLWALPTLARTQPLQTSAQEHERLLRAVVGGDAETARSIMVHHLEHTRGLWAGHTEG